MNDPYYLLKLCGGCEELESSLRDAAGTIRHVLGCAKHQRPHDQEAFGHVLRNRIPELETILAELAEIIAETDYIEAEIIKAKSIEDAQREKQTAANAGKLF